VKTQAFHCLMTYTTKQLPKSRGSEWGHVGKWEQTHSSITFTFFYLVYIYIA